MSSAIPAITNSRCSPPTMVSRCAICGSDVLPVAPYSNAMPNSRKPLANAPSRKYFNAASFDRSSLRAMPARAYAAIDMTSRPRKITMRSVAVAINTMPSVENRTRE